MFFASSLITAFQQVGILEELKDWDFAAVKAEAKAGLFLQPLHHGLEQFFCCKVNIK